MKIATAKEMKDIDGLAIRHYGIPGAVLMERAGVAVARCVKEEFRDRRVTVLAGSGNNGGDGLVAARELHNAGMGVRAVMLGSKSRLSPDCRAQLLIAKKMGVAVEFREKLSAMDVHGAVVIDSIFGTGLSREIAGPVAKAIGFINDSASPVVSVDIPSGISADTGEVHGVAVMAHRTVTFGLPKRGHFLHPGADHTGRLTVEDIGFPRVLFDPVRCSLLTGQDMAPLVPERQANSHKGDYGHVLVVAGSTGKTGAALMAARSCLRSGAGLVSVGVPAGLVGPLQSRVTEEMLLPLADTGEGALSYGALDGILAFLDTQADVLALGPGLGRGAETGKLVKELLKRCTAPMVVDADALNALEGRASLLGKARAPIILTPHPGEFSRLTGKGVDEIERDRPGAAAALARKTGAYVVLKGAPSVIAVPEGDVFINSTGNAGMATAGVGDVLAGVLAALLGQGLGPAGASALGVYLHGLAGDLAAADKGMHSLIASDIIGALPEALKGAGEQGRWKS